MLTIVLINPGSIQTIESFRYICSMETQDIIKIIEQQRLKARLHKTKLCSQADISTTYYNELLNGLKSPSYAILKALLDAFDMEMVCIMRIKSE